MTNYTYTLINSETFETVQINRFFGNRENFVDFMDGMTVAYLSGKSKFYVNF
jgi:hypothetical protein